MKRALLIPGVVSVAAFVGLVAILSGATSSRRDDARELTAISPVAALPQGIAATGASLLSQEDAERALARVTDDYTRDWRTWENARRHIYSRVAPRHVSPIEANIQWASTESGAGEAAFLAAIVVTAGKSSDTIPCVIDRTTGQMAFFADGQWLAQDAWLKTAPLPRGARNLERENVSRRSLE